MTQVITANDFASGGVVYLSKEGWQGDLNQALVFDNDQTAADALAAHNFPSEVVGVYAIDVAINAGEIKPVHIREVLRAEGPSPRVLTAQPNPSSQQGDRHVSL
jgi:hypothetical protein